ncbi:PTS sugar transporter subunit IIB [Erysipelothrix larvae]|uniref:PTS sugar transporter subunit IIB n=1 Tax=Erysipelothrix larvae TaxID=1514105 RepID=A0A0X8H1J9_9FIRM|nr:PTS sugar transporter subunit IIB [Erysipelothrix larvae]AMC94419.1 PTS sugar transporter subunit IIB [Erysipelothrix larvae]
MARQILLLCGTGASSGFMASNARSAAKDMGVDLTFIARSDAVVEDYIEDSALIMVGPHLSYMVDDLKEITEEYGVRIEIISEEIYGQLDGKGLVNQALKLLGE